jgi:hypothetical protein
VSYNSFTSFRQKYTPTNNTGSDHFSEIEHRRYYFGDMLILSFGFKKHFGNRYSFGVDAVAPLISNWRKDDIFNDDSSKFFHPRFGAGISISLQYNFRRA